MSFLPPPVVSCLTVPGTNASHGFRFLASGSVHLMQAVQSHAAEKPRTYLYLYRVEIPYCNAVASYLSSYHIRLPPTSPIPSAESRDDLPFQLRHCPPPPNKVILLVLGPPSAPAKLLISRLAIQITPRRPCRSPLSAS